MEGDAQVVVADRTVEFQLSSSHHLEDLDVATLWDGIRHNVPWKDAYDDHLTNVREMLNTTKKQLDSKDVKSYYEARDTLFPLATSGAQGATFRNRAGFKLLESMQVAGTWEHITKYCKQHGGLRSIAFADVCGGPGAFSQALYTSMPKYFKSLRGFGMTLLNEGDQTLQWYPSLASNPNFRITYGIEGTGNIYATENLHALASLTRSASCPLLLIVADGGFDVPFDVAHFQEAISLRVVYGQWLSAVVTLTVGGCLVLKLFDTFTPFIRSMLYLSTILYDRVHIVKPKHSRVVNSERYLVCLGFRGCSEALRSYLLKVHACAFSDDTAPQTLIPDAIVKRDGAFAAAMETLNHNIATTQTAALKMVLASSLLREAAA
jgi:cap1 methyltransferase